LAFQGAVGIRQPLFLHSLESLMRALILIAASLALAACGNNDHSDNTQNVDENLTAENIVSNDVTAIDAVTGDAANMAAAAEINDIGNVDNGAGNASAFPRPKPQTIAPSPAKSAPATTSATPPVANTTTNSQ
jgi:hypothetical protein